MQKWLDKPAMLGLSEDSYRELTNRLKLNTMRECLQHARLQWFGHLEIKEENSWSLALGQG